MLRHLDLFSGIGGFSLGLESAGLVETVAFCDFDKYCKKILNKHWPQVPVYDNVKELNYDRLKSDGIISGEKGIDIITGGYPCQPFSVAGKQKGEDDPRHVWPEMFRLIQELRPTWVIGENVAGHIKLGLDTVLANLESEGYSSRTFSISASSIGANHQRERIWIIANSNELGRNYRFDNRERRYFSYHQEWDIEEGQPKWKGWIHRVGEASSTMADSERMGWSEGSEKSEELEREKSSDQSDHSSEGRRQSKSSENVADSTTHRSFDESKRNIGSLGKESSGKEETRDQSSVCTETRSSERSSETMADSDSERTKGHEKNRSLCENRGDQVFSDRVQTSKEINVGGNSDSRGKEKIMADSDTGHGQQQNKEVRPGGNTSDSSSEDLAYSKSFGSHERELGNSEEEDRQERQVRGEVGRGDGDRNDSFIEDNLADSNSERLERFGDSSSSMCGSDERNDFDEQSSEGTRSEGPHQTEGWWDFEPDVGRVAYGVPNRVDRLKCLGNSVVPQIPYLLGVSIRKTIESEKENE